MISLKNRFRNTTIYLDVLLLEGINIYIEKNLSNITKPLCKPQGLLCTCRHKFRVPKKLVATFFSHAYVSFDHNMRQGQ